jgi:arylsulfatase A-like enzyme
VKTATPETRATRRAFLGGAAGGLLAACGGAPAPEAPKRWNIVWIVADDLSPDLGCYGYAPVHSPNIDKLAAEGRRYTNAYVTAPVCSPSRSAFITGMYQTSLGAHNHRSHRDDDYRLPAPVRPITDLFREAGYYTANEKSGLGGRAKQDYNFGFEPGYTVFDGTDWTERAEGQPFYAQVNIFEPHRGRPPAIWSFTEELPEGERIDPAQVKLPSYYPDDPVVRKDWAGYLDAVALLDKKVGATLAAIDEQGLRDNTVVMFFGDHGRPMPRDKQFLYDGGIRIPLIIRWPGELEGGSVSDELVQTIDLSATSLALAGIERPAYMEGRIFLGQNKDPSREYIFSARDRCGDAVDRIRCVRDKRYKYIRNFMPERAYMQMSRYKDVSYPSWRQMKRLHAGGKLTPEQELFLAQTRPEEELYDTAADPDEVHNLAGSGDHLEILDRMSNVLNMWIEATGDMGAIPEDPALVEKYRRASEEVYKEAYEELRAAEPPW